MSPHLGKPMSMTRAGSTPVKDGGSPRSAILTLFLRAVRQEVDSLLLQPRILIGSGFNSCTIDR